jgi:hypothetical protein
MVNSKYFSPIPKGILTGIKTENKKRIFCKIHKTQKLTKSYNQRVCKICDKISRNKSTKKYLKKKENEKNAKFQFFGVIKKC